MILSKDSAANMLRSRGWSPLSPQAVCFNKAECPVTIRLTDDNLDLQETAPEVLDNLSKITLTDPEGVRVGSAVFELTEDGLTKAIEAAEGADIKLGSG